MGKPSNIAHVWWDTGLEETCGSTFSAPACTSFSSSAQSFTFGICLKIQDPLLAVQNMYPESWWNLVLRQFWNIILGPYAWPHFLKTCTAQTKIIRMHLLSRLASVDMQLFQILRTSSTQTPSGHLRTPLTIWASSQQRNPRPSVEPHSSPCFGPGRSSSG